MWPRLKGSSSSPRIERMRPSSTRMATPHIASQRLQVRKWVSSDGVTAGKPASLSRTSLGGIGQRVVSAQLSNDLLRDLGARLLLDLVGEAVQEHPLPQVQPNESLIVVPAERHQHDRSEMPTHGTHTCFPAATQRREVQAGRVGHGCTSWCQYTR